MFWCVCMVCGENIVVCGGFLRVFGGNVILFGCGGVVNVRNVYGVNVLECVSCWW